MMIERRRNMAQINRDRIAGMNIHYPKLFTEQYLKR